MVNLAHLAMHHAAGAHDAPAELLADTLMTETDAENRNFAGETLVQRQRNPRLVRRAGPWRDYDLPRAHFGDLLKTDFVVAEHLDLRAQLAEILHHVPGEGIVIVEHQQHGCTIPVVSAANAIRIRENASRSETGLQDGLMHIR